MSKFSIGRILGCLLLILVSASTTLAKPIILNSSESARPGDIVYLQGSQFGGSPQVWFQNVSALSPLAPAQALVVVNTQSTGYVAAAIPASETLGLYALWVKDGTTLSDPIFINRARGVQCEYPALSSGYAFRVFGRNLTLPGFIPTATFVNVNTGARLPATVTLAGSDAFTLHLAAPSMASGALYTLVLNNGAGGTYGAADAEDTVSGRTGGPDPFGLRVPWGPDLGKAASNVYNVRTDPRLSVHAQGNGVANDRDAIQAAIDKATAAGGGTVYLPAGTYCVDYTPRMGVNCFSADKLLLLKSGVVLRGDGQDSGGLWRTTLQWGFNTGLTVAQRPRLSYGIMFDIGAFRSGITGLRCRNLNGAVVTGSVACYNPQPTQSRLFVTNDEFDNGTSSGLNLSGADELLLANTITVQSSIQHVLDLNNGSHYWVRNNSVTYTVDRLFASQCDHFIFENNHITRDGDNFPPFSVTGKGTGGLSSEQSRQVVILNNTFDATGAALPSYNDGETILSEWVAPNRDTGAVTAANANTLQDASKHWAFAYAGQGYEVAIVRGTGLGQVRGVLSSTANALTVDRPWLVVPDATSRYTLMQPTAEEWLVKNNTLQDVPRGIWIYEGGRDCAIVSNVLSNAGQIFLRAAQLLNESSPRFEICWNMRVEDNTVADTNGLRLASIAGWEDREDSYALWGVGLLGTEVRRNQVTAYAPTAAQRWEGFGNYVLWVYPETGPANDSDAGILGTIFQDNAVANAFNGYYTGTGASATTIWNVGVTGSAQTLSDSVIAGAARGSDHTIIGAPPAGFSAAVGAGTVALTWQPVAGASGYQVYRASASGGPYDTPRMYVAAPGCVDQGLAGGTQYYYVVRATYSGAPALTSLPSGVVAFQARLAVPRGLAVTPGAGQATLTWLTVAGASSYNIYRAPVSGGPYVQIGQSGATAYTDDGVPNGQTAYYVVAAVNAYETSAYSDEASTTPQSAPYAPGSLSASPGNAQISLTWDAASGATGYNVYRSTVSGSGYTRIATQTPLSKLDTGLVNGKIYYYQVRGVNAGVEGPPSPDAACAPVALPVAPNTLSVKAGSATLSVSWHASPTAASYLVYRSTTHGGPYSQVGTASASPYTDSAVTKGVVYYYIVTAVNAGGKAPVPPKCRASTFHFGGTHRA